MSNTNYIILWSPEMNGLESKVNECIQEDSDWVPAGGVFYSDKDEIYFQAMYRKPVAPWVETVANRVPKQTTMVDYSWPVGMPEGG